jgi:hypothetical protein
MKMIASIAAWTEPETSSETPAERPLRVEPAPSRENSTPFDVPTGSAGPPSINTRHARTASSRATSVPSTVGIAVVRISSRI